MILALLLPVALADEPEIPPDDVSLVDETPTPTRPVRQALTLAVGVTATADLGVGSQVAVKATQPLLGRVRLYAGVGFGAPARNGTMEQDGAIVTWTARHRLLALSGGVELRALRAEEAISPELSVGPALCLVSRRVEGDRDGAELPSSTWTATRGGVHGGFALAGDVGPGALVGAVGLDWLPRDGLTVVTPTLGWRVSR